MAIIEIKNTDITYYMDDKLKQNIDKRIMPLLEKKDKDYVLVIDGYEGSGKSTLAFQIGMYADPTFNLNRICFTPEQFTKAIMKAKKGECVIFDEAFTGLSSRTALSSMNKLLVSLMMQMRQNNLFVIIVMPTIFLLDKYVAIWRARSLLHVFETKTGLMGYFKIYSNKKKKALILSGKQYYSYKVRPRKSRRFYGKFALGKEMEIEYRKRKGDAFKEFHTKKESYTENRKFRERKFLILDNFTLRKKIANYENKKPPTLTEFCKILKKQMDIELETTLISHYRGDIREYKERMKSESDISN